MEMRLGKTLVCLRRCRTYSPVVPERGFRGIVFAPSSALDSWQDELDTEGWSYENICPLPKLKRIEALNRFDSEWILANKEAWKSVGCQLAEKRWDVVVADESHFLKNPRAKVTKFFLKSFGMVPHRWVLTGTPEPEDAQDWFCPMTFCFGSFMGQDKFWNWRQKYFKPYVFNWVPKKGTREKITKEVADLAIVMRRKEVGKDVKRVSETRWVELPPKIRKAYKTMEDNFILEVDGKEVSRTEWVGAQYQALRQICSGIMEEVEHKAKFNELVELATGELSGEPIVVWCVYRNEVQKAYEVLKSAGLRVGVIHGNIKPEDRTQVRKQFQEKKKLDAIVVQYQTAETGMNLSRSDTNIYLSEPPGFVAWNQTRDRILDTEQKTPLLDVNIVVRDSVDEDNHIALRAKGVRNDLTFKKILEEQFWQRKRRK
jgi:hypothetical protein